jgi:hypothetical protein|tara:strand:+ start:103 stop:357 length:255 start_codon:yes stop_codon:yes gene_type:complete
MQVLRLGLMPLVITRPPDPEDPDYQQLEQLINLAVHGAAFAAFNSGLWVWHGLKPGFFPQLPLLTGLWAVVFLVHVGWVVARRS